MIPWAALNLASGLAGAADMSLRRRNYEEDLLWLKWPLICLGVAIAAAVGMALAASSYQDEMRQDEFNRLSDLDLLQGQVREIEEAEQIIVNNIGVYEQMESRRLLDAEDRVALLDDIAALRDEYNLYPISVDIGTQYRVLIPYRTEVNSPEEQISLRSTRVQLQLALLHEGDLARLLEGIFYSDRLMVIEECAINSALGSESDFLTLVQHQMASCSLIWYSFRREPYSELEF